MTVTVIANPDGSYAWVEGTYTEADLEAVLAAPDQVAWLKTNATIQTKPSP